jgi:D-alanyl-D-alanine carboxypeptidase
VPSHRADTPAVRRSRTTKGRRRSSRRATQRGQLLSLNGPQVGIASALGLATIAAPISGAMSSPAASAGVAPARTAALAPAPVFPELSSSPLPAVEDLQVVPAESNALASVPKMLSAPRTLLVTRASRARERSVLPGCDGARPSVDSPNGQLPTSVLCTLWEPKFRLRADAAVSLAKLNIAYKQRFGENLCLTDGYRTLASQQRVRAIKPGLAAVPGTSQHGWGRAVDLCGGVQRSGNVRYEWMRASGAAYGWANPDWARPGGSGPFEAWHWEFTPA